MTITNVPPDVQRLLSKMSQRIDILERRLRALENSYEPELPFVQSGAVSVGESPPWIRRKGGTLVGVLVALGAAGSSATVVTVRKNGSTVATVTLAAGTDQAETTLSEPAAPNMDRFTAAVTTAGSGATDLTVHTRWDQ